MLDPYDEHHPETGYAPGYQHVSLMTIRYDTLTRWSADARCNLIRPQAPKKIP